MKETESLLVKEKTNSQIFMEALGQKEGPELEAAHKDIQIALLKQQTELLMKKLEETTLNIDAKIAGITSKVEKIQFAPIGPGAASV